MEDTQHEEKSKPESDPGWLQPEAAQAMRTAYAQSNSIVQQLGPEKTTGAVGALLILIGAFLPLAFVATPGNMFVGSAPTSQGMSLIGLGAGGFIFVAVTLAIAAGPFYLASTRSNDLVALGVSALGLGMALSVYLAITAFKELLGGFGTALNIGTGEYALIFGLLATTYVYFRRAQLSS